MPGYLLTVKFCVSTIFMAGAMCVCRYAMGNCKDYMYKLYLKFVATHKAAYPNIAKLSYAMVRQRVQAILHYKSTETVSHMFATGVLENLKLK